MQHGGGQIDGELKVAGQPRPVNALFAEKKLRENLSTGFQDFVLGVIQSAFLGGRDNLVHLSQVQIESLLAYFSLLFPGAAHGSGYSPELKPVPAWKLAPPPSRPVRP